METFLELAGISFTIGGFLLEALGVAAAAFYPVRRRVAFSPFSLISLGGCAFFAGQLVWVAAKSLAK